MSARTTCHTSQWPTARTEKHACQLRSALWTIAEDRLTTVDSLSGAATLRHMRAHGLGILLLLVLPGCARPVASTAGAAKDVQVETYLGDVEAKVAGDVGVLTIRAAAEQTLRARGYTITESYGTAERARIRASGAGEYSRRDRTQIDIWTVPGASRLRIAAGSAGDETAAKAILDEVLTRLGR